eukprot:1119136_1
MADDEDVQASSNSSHSSPNQKLTDSGAKDEKQEEFDQMTPRATTTMHDEDVQSSCSSLHSSPNQKRTVSLDPRYNDSKAKPHLSHSNLEKPNNNLDKPSKTSEQEGSMVQTPRAMGTIYDDDDANEDVRIQDAAIDTVSKRLLSKLSQRPSIDVAMARGILLFRVDTKIDYNLQSRYQQLRRRKVAQHLEQMILSRRQTRMELEPERRMSSDPTQVEASAWFFGVSPITLSPQVITPRNNAYINAMLRTIESLHASSTDIHTKKRKRTTLQSYSDDDNEEDEWQEEEELEKMIIQKRGHVFQKLKKLCMRELAEGKGGWITNQDDSDTEVPIEIYFTGTLVPLIKYLKDEDYDEMDYLLCEHDEDFDTILGVIKKGMADDKGKVPKRETPKEDSEVRPPHAITTIHDDVNDVEASSSSVHSSPHHAARQSAITPKTVDLSSPSAQRKAKPHQSDSNDAEEDEKHEELMKMIIEKRGHVFKKLKQLCMRELAEGEGGWITNQDDSDTEVPIETHFTGALAPLVKYLKDADYDEMDYVLCEHEDDFETILGVIKKGMADDKGNTSKRGTSRNEDSEVRPLHPITTTYDDDANGDIESSSNPTHSSPSQKPSASLDLSVDSASKKRKTKQHQSSSNDANNPTYEELEKMMIHKRGPVFNKLKKLCMRELAEGKGGWITTQDDSDTEVPIERYFTGALAPMIKYLKDADYDEMDY